MRRTANRIRQPHSDRAVPRRGSVLVLVAMILFGLLGLATLVIDIGFVRVTQRQMKQATDAAALEGLQKTDVVVATPATFTGRTAATETGRRQAAADFVTVLFDDDFDASDDVRNFGAGPQVSLSGGIALQDGFSASQDLAVPDPPVYKPALQLNAGNDPDGDIVTTTDALTVRLQRNDNGTQAGVASNGGSLPFLFGRGTLMPSSVKASGVELTVASTAKMQPVVRVGTRQTVGSVTIPGGIAFGISRTVWESLPANTPTSIPLAAGSVGTTATVLNEIGEAGAIAPTPFTGDGYCPIVETVGGTLRVIGFGWAGIVPDSLNASNVMITKHRDVAASETVAAENATARRSEAWTSLGSLSDADRDTVITSNQSFADPLVSAVLQAGG